jgi:uncharacterized protein with ParB-like and HNH nuclease domain
MEANPVRIIQYFDGTKQSMIPLFQRPYTWETEKWAMLWEDIMNHYDSGGTQSHFMGAVVSIPVRTVPVGVNKHLVIDGQQRLTTLAILLAVIRDLADERTAARIDDYLINRHHDGADRLKLLPTHGDREVYKRLVLERALTTSPTRITDAYHWFKKAIASNHDSAPIDPLQVLETIEQCLQVVMINLGDTDDPYLIFESLNAKGEPLTQADLVRNYVLMKFRDSLETGGEQERIYDSYWRPIQDSLGVNLTDFLRHYCMRDGVAVEKRAVYTAIKTRLSKKTDNAAIEDELNDMRRLGDFYLRFIEPAKETDAEIQTRLRAFTDLDVTTCYPLLLRLFDSLSKQAISPGDLKACLRIIESFVVRRAVCGVPTNSLAKMFTQWSKDYPAVEIVGRLSSAMADGARNARWPGDSEFKVSFQTAPQYGKNVARHVLISIEESFQHREPANLQSATIEHVMPQELNAEWEQMLGPRHADIHQRLLHTFGNLTLTGYNSELGNLAFGQKKVKLSNSHIDLNRWICEQDHWTEPVIDARARLLADLAVKLWIAPAVPSAATA